MGVELYNPDRKLFSGFSQNATHILKAETIYKQKFVKFYEIVLKKDLFLFQA